jgi:hypothetical protein
LRPFDLSLLYLFSYCSLDLTTALFYSTTLACGIIRVEKKYRCYSTVTVCMDIQSMVISTSQYGHINSMRPLLTQVKILASIHKMSFLNNLTLFRMVNSFYHFKQFLMQIFSFVMGNSKFLTFKLKKTIFPVII